MLIFFLVWRFRKRVRFEGQLFLFWAISYAIARFVLEIFRGDSLYLMPGVPIAQVTSFVLFILAISLYMKRKDFANPPLKDVT